MALKQTADINTINIENVNIKSLVAKLEKDEYESSFILLINYTTEQNISKKIECIFNCTPKCCERFCISIQHNDIEDIIFNNRIPNSYNNEYVSQKIKHIFDILTINKESITLDLKSNESDDGIDTISEFYVVISSIDIIKFKFKNIHNGYYTHCINFKVFNDKNEIEKHIKTFI